MSYFVGLMQVNLRVRNLDASIQWYVEKLGLTVLKKYGDHTAVLGFEGNVKEPYQSPTICLIALGSDEESSMPAQNGTYPVLQLSAGYRETIYEELKSKGVRVENNPRHRAHFCFYDMDDNLLELYSPGIYS